MARRGSNSGHEDLPTVRAYRAKGPTLGKGKACESCRTKRTRCDGGRPTCSKCVQSGSECRYLERARSTASTAALSDKLLSLEERYRILSEVEAARTGVAPPPGSPFTADSAMDWSNILNFDQLPPQHPTVEKVSNDVMDDPYLDRSMTKAERRTMIGLFVREGYRYINIYWPSKFLDSLDDPDVSRRPHPCLINAVLLVAADFAVTFPVAPVLDEYGSRFVEFTVPASLPPNELLLARAQAQRARSLADVDRLQDYVQASILLALWFFRHGRLLEAQFTVSAVTRLVINCKLHRIDDKVLQEMAPRREPPPHGQSVWDGTLLERPKSVEDLVVRIGIFWQSFYTDKTIGLMSGLPSSYDDSEAARITTVWPREMDEYLNGTAFSQPYASYQHLFDGSSPPPRSIDRPHTRLLKSLALLCQAVKLIDSPAVTQQELDNLYLGIWHVRSAFGTLHDHMLLALQAAQSRNRPFTEISFKALIQLYLHGAAIQATYIKTIDGPPYDEQAKARERLDAARASSAVMANAMDEMEKVLPLRTDGKKNGLEHMCYTSGMLMSSASGVLVDQIHNLEEQLEKELQVNPQSARTAELEALLQSGEHDLNILLEGVDRVRITYPIVDVLMARIQRLKARTEDVASPARKTGGLMQIM